MMRINDGVVPPRRPGWDDERVAGKKNEEDRLGWGWRECCNLTTHEIRGNERFH